MEFNFRSLLKVSGQACTGRLSHALFYKIDDIGRCSMDSGKLGNPRENSRIYSKKYLIGLLERNIVTTV